jgi:hypothetical protein
VYFSYEFIFNNKFEPILKLLLGVSLRQLCQYVNRLPSPDHVIWFDPGFPSLIMNYEVADDFFFSGHTLVSFIFGVELLNSLNIYVKLYALFYMFIEIIFVLVSRSHYFMDIYGSISTYYMLSYFCDIYLIKFFNETWA